MSLPEQKYQVVSSELGAQAISFKFLFYVRIEEWLFKVTHFFPVVITLSSITLSNCSFGLLALISIFFSHISTLYSPDKVLVVKVRCFASLAGTGIHSTEV